MSERVGIGSVSLSVSTCVFSAGRLPASSRLVCRDGLAVAGRVPVMTGLYPSERAGPIENGDSDRYQKRDKWGDMANLHDPVGGAAVNTKD
jgi:hypothetical protein